MTQPDTTFYRPRGEVITNISRLYTHVFAGGRRCASPALRGETLCYNHQPSRLNLPTRADRLLARPTTQLELQQALAVVLQAIAHNRIASRRAGRLLTALQQLSNNLPERSQPPSIPLLNRLT